MKTTINDISEIVSLVQQIQSVIDVEQRDVFSVTIDAVGDAKVHLDREDFLRFFNSFESENRGYDSKYTVRIFKMIGGVRFFSLMTSKQFEDIKKDHSPQVAANKNTLTTLYHEGGEIAPFYIQQ